MFHIAPRIAAQLAAADTAVLVPDKRQCAAMPSGLLKVIAEWRNRIETTFAEITDQMELARHGAHTSWGLLTRTAATTAAHTLKPPTPAKRERTHITRPRPPIPKPKPPLQMRDMSDDRPTRKWRAAGQQLPTAPDKPRTDTCDCQFSADVSVSQPGAHPGQDLRREIMAVTVPSLLERVRAVQ
jgi:hypothetical protein